MVLKLHPTLSPPPHLKCYIILDVKTIKAQEGQKQKPISTKREGGEGGGGKIDNMINNKHWKHALYTPQH